MSYVAIVLVCGSTMINLPAEAFIPNIGDVITLRVFDNNAANYYVVKHRRFDYLERHLRNVYLNCDLLNCDLISQYEFME